MVKNSLDFASVLNALFSSPILAYFVSDAGGAVLVTGRPWP